jgi:adenosylhomocysteine nucleosidase
MKFIGKTKVPVGARNNLTADVVVIVSANAEWQVVRSCPGFAAAKVQMGPYGEWFEQPVEGRRAIFLQGGWGKISAAASAQYAIDRWQPALLVNLGTCGGLAGRIERGEILLVERTLVYDIIEQMGDPQAAIEHYATRIDLSWLAEPYPMPVRRALLVSADRDICLADIPMLVEKYAAIAADWETGAIAWVAARNAVHCLILRGVSDLVGETGGEAYDDYSLFQDGARQVMLPLLKSLPEWLSCSLHNQGFGPM